LACTLAWVKIPALKYYFTSQCNPWWYYFMPIYEYQCQACQHEIEALQKMSDSPLLDCPQCGEASLKKKVSAVAFRLKGSGWYETDFKTGDKKNLVGGGDGGDGGGSADAGAGDKSAPADSAPTKSSENKSGDSKSGDSKSGDRKKTA
jgi:putative FmdB family regulatory protein